MQFSYWGSKMEVSLHGIGSEKSSRLNEMKILATIAGMFMLLQTNFAQIHPFEIQLNPLTISELGGVQSFAVAQHEGKWLIVGGRLDGLHRRQPFASFDIAGHNNQWLVVDPEAGIKWAAPFTDLPQALQERLSATNMEFYQEGGMLYLVGGYGYSKTAGDHITYPYLTAIDVKQTINAIIQQQTVTPFIRQISDDSFTVTGGSLKKINDIFYLTGGQKFMGRYNPHGPNHGPGFVQEYTDAIRRFKINDDGTTISVTHLGEWKDTAQLHRRDFNVIPQIMPDGQQGLTAFSGVFRRDADLPFLNSVNIDSSGHIPNPDFIQYYNHYHCATIPLYSAAQNEMHSLFFGGIAQYYDSAGTMKKDNDVPFVKTIARVTRTADGSMQEVKLPVEMPGLLGAGSEWIRNESLKVFANGVIDYDALPTGSTLLGYIFGGIESTAPNIFWSNSGKQSTAQATLFKVLIIKP